MKKFIMFSSLKALNVTLWNRFNCLSHKKNRKVGHFFLKDLQFYKHHIVADKFNINKYAHLAEKCVPWNI